MILLSSVLVACDGVDSQAKVARSELVPTLELTAETAGTTAPNPEPTAQPAAKVSALLAELDPQALGDATYTGILDRAITLVDGRYVGEPFVAGGASRPTVTLLTEPIAYGDLNGDGQLEAVVLLASDSGGSGTFIYLSAMEARDGAPYNVATTLLGDRDQPQTLAIIDGRVIVELLSHDGDDPACCPTMEMVREFTLDGEMLVEVE